MTKSYGAKELINKHEFFHGEIEELDSIKNYLTEDKIAGFFQKAISEQIRNVFISPFKDGDAFYGLDVNKELSNLNPDDFFEKLSTLPCSVRLTNIQILSEDIKKLCLSMYKESGYPVTVNMYVTPGEGKNCFLYHPDPQETLVYQIKGDKKWMIPLDDNNNKIIASTAEEHYVGDFKNLYQYDLKEGQFSYLPHCMVHKAEANKGLSIHITFAFLTHFKTSFKLFLEDEIAKSIGFKESYYDILDDESLRKWINDSKKYLLSQSPEEMMRKIKARINSEEIQILKYGRPYLHRFAAND